MFLKIQNKKKINYFHYQLFIHQIEDRIDKYSIWKNTFLGWLLCFGFKKCVFSQANKPRSLVLLETHRTRVLWVFLFRNPPIFCELIRPVARGICFKPSVVMIKRFWGYCLKFKYYNYNRAMLYFRNVMREQILVTGFWLYGRFSIIMHLLKSLFSHCALSPALFFSSLLWFGQFLRTDWRPLLLSSMITAHGPLLCTRHHRSVHKNRLAHPVMSSQLLGHMLASELYTVKEAWPRCF